jgi:hypothetical protein
MSSEHSTCSRICGNARVTIRRNITRHLRATVDREFHMPVLPPMNTARLERMGLSSVDHLYVRQLLKSVADEKLAFPKYRTCPNATDEEGRLPPDCGIKINLSHYFDVLHLKHLGVDVPGLDIPTCLQRIVALTEEYFLGDWRDSGDAYDEAHDRAGWRQEAYWVDEFRKGLLVTLLTDNRAALRSICSFVGPDLPPDEGSWDRVDDDRHVLIHFAEVLPEFVQSRRLPVNWDFMSVRRKRAKAMLQGLQCLPENDEQNFVKAVQVVVDSFVQSDFKDPTHSRVPVSWEGSILYRLAEIVWPKTPSLADKTMDYLLTRESLGLK